MTRVKPLIDKLLNSRLTNDERKSLETSIDGNPLVKNIIKEQLSDGFQKASEDFENAFLDFQKKTSEKTEKQESKKVLFGAGIAASIVLLIGMVSFLQYNSSSNQQLENKSLSREIVLTTPDGKETVLDSNEESRVEKLIADNFLGKKGYSTIYVPKGMTYKTRLSDGTLVHLNADTELQFPISFNEDVRRVKLQGEGFFEVVSNKKKPFIVVSDNIETKVYGTKFNISSYETGSATEVTLIEGSVGVKHSELDVERMIVPNEMFAWGKETESYKITKVNVNDKISWMRGLVVLNNSSLENIIPVIERKFDIKVEVLDTSLRDKKFSGKLSVNTVEELEAIFNATKIFGCQYYANDKKLLIK